MSDTLTVEQALALLPQREPDEDGLCRVHTFIEAAGHLIGADWDHPAVVKLLERAEAIYATTGKARAMGNALCVLERGSEGTVRRIFIEGETG